jgi:glutathione synthase/RimK-type ligase-like ATP-grasp enzyme
VHPDSIVRIESPGRDFEVERLLLAAGADAAAEEDFASLRQQDVAQMVFDKGRLWFPRQWYLGFRAALDQIEVQLADCPPHQRMNHAPDVAVMFDKPACHALLLRQGISVPRSLGSVESYEALLEAMAQSRCSRVFVKLAHGSSASGVVAYRRQGDGRQQAITTVEMAPTGGETRLYNTRRICAYDDPRQIAALIDALCRHRVHVEEWIPKAGHAGQVFDLRIVVIGGKVRHCAARLSHSPMTNLHLLNQRDTSEELLGRIPVSTWEAVRQSCLEAMRCFPSSLYAGLDVLIDPSFRRHAILEINAFGDLLPGVLHRGQDTYVAEIEAMQERIAC